MSEQKGSYAHVGLPGLRELFAGGEKVMKEDSQQRLSEIQKIYETQLANGNRTIQLNVPSFEFLLQQLTEKDEIIEALRISKEHEIELHARTCIEKDETIKALREDKRKIYAIYEEQCARGSEYYNENIRLRKALAVARYDIKQITKYPDDKEYTSRFETLALEQINAALGEGDKDGN